MPALAQQAADTLDAALWGTKKEPGKAKKGSKGKKKQKTATKTATTHDEGL